MEDLDELLPRADIVAMILPGGPATEHVMDERRLRLMKPGAYLINDGRGNAIDPAALKKVLEYLTENEGISCVTAWCAAENIGSQKVLEKAGMKFLCTEKNALTVGDSVYDKLTYEYRS